MMKISKWLEAAAVLVSVVSFYLYVLRRLKSELRDEIAQAKKLVRRAHTFDVKDAVISEVARRRTADCSLLRDDQTTKKSWKLKVLFGKISKLKAYVRPELDFKVIYNSQLECLEVEARDLQLYVTVLEYYRRRLVLFSYFRKRKKCFALRLSHKGEVLVESEDIYLVFKILVRLLLSHFPPHVLLREEHLPAGAQCHPEGP